MRIACLCLLLALFSRQLTAQEIRFENMDPSGPSGVVVHDQSQMAVAYFLEDLGGAKGDSQQLVLTLISPEIHEVMRTSLSVEAGVEGLQVCFSGEFYFLQWKHRVNRSRTYVSMDQQGIEIFRQVDENLSADQLDNAMDPWMITVDPQQILLIRRMKSHGGLELTALDRQLNSAWTSKVEPLERKWEMKDCLRQDDRVVFLMAERDGKGNLDGAQLVAISINDGKEIYRAKIEGGLESRAEMIRLMEDGNIYCAGTLIDAETEDLAGLFYTYVSADGKPFHSSRFHWELMPQADSLAYIVESFKEGKSLVRVREILMDGTHDIHLVCEIFTRSENAGVKSRKASSESSGSRILLGDLVIFKFGGDGSPRGIILVNREPIPVDVIGLPSRISRYALSQWLESKKAFTVMPYKGMGMQDGFIYRKWEDGNPHLCYCSLNDTSVRAGECGLLTRQPRAEAKAGTAGMISLDYSSESTGNWYDRSPLNVIPLRQGRFLFYEKRGPVLEVWSQTYSPH